MMPLIRPVGGGTLISMGRVRTNVRVGRRNYWTLFDTGARITYVIPSVARGLAKARLPSTLTAALGGAVRKVTSTCVLVARIELWAS
jgi:hypothetical protein